MSRLALAATIIWLSGMSAAAQTPNPVVQHYRAYQAALDANDMITAEREAAAALAASQERDGDGGRTAVLAFNLAAIRFENGNAAGALEPGRRALAIAQTTGEERSGVSPVLAQLIIHRAELASGDISAPERLQAVLDRAQQAELAPAEIHDAANELGVWLYANGRFGEARRAWSIAGAYAEGSRFGAPYARATAMTGEAAALLLEDLEGQRRRPKISEDAARDAHGLLAQALAALGPLAEVNADGEITLAQRSYANALAWRAVLRAKLMSDGQEIPEVQEAQGDADGLSEVDVPAPYDSRPRCLVRILPRGDGVHLYPERAAERGQLAGLAVRFRINEAGQVADADAIAVIGGEEFARSVENVRHWRVTLRDDSPPNCRMAMSVIQSIAFSIG